MRGFLRALPLVVGIMLVLVQSAPAFQVSSINVDPSGPLLPGTWVIGTGKIDFTPSGGVTYNGTRAIQISSSLVNAQWACYVIDETSAPKNPEGPRLNRILQCPWDIPSPFYPKNDEKPIKFTVEGRAPAVNGTTNITLLRIQESDENGSTIPGSLYEKLITLVDVRDIVPSNTTLERFRKQIEEKKAMGVNVSAAEEKYQNATRIYDTIQNASPAKIFSIQVIENQFNILHNDIAEGERLLDKAWAEKEVADAQEKVDELDALIGWFRNNASTAHNSYLPSIVTKREIAAAYLTTSKDEISNGKYELARQNAGAAYDKANSVLAQSEPPRPKADPLSWNLTMPVMVAVFSVIVIAVAGIYWWRKRKRWSLE